MFGPVAFPAAGAFFFSAWLAMIFWGMISPDLGIPTIGYARAMLVTIALWLVAFPLTWVGLGRGMRMGGFRHRERVRGPSGPDDVNLTAVFSGSSRRVSSRSFRGGKITAVFGGVQLDLRNAAVEQRPATLDVTAVFGGAEIKVPSDWRVEIDTAAVFGGSSDERKQVETPSEGPPHLILTGTTVFGGVSIKD